MPRQIIPRAVIIERLKSWLINTEKYLAFLGGELNLAQRFLIAPPPPIPEEEHIRRYPEIFNFKVDVLENAMVRLKIYELYIDLVKLMCLRRGIHFVPAPNENRDQVGFLLQQYWNQCTHATPDYYGNVMKLVEAVNDAPI